MNSKIKKLAEALEKEIGVEVHMETEEKDEEDELSWRYPISEKGELIIAVERDKENNEILLGSIDRKGMKVQTISMSEAKGYIASAITTLITNAEVFGLSRDLMLISDMTSSDVGTPLDTLFSGQFRRFKGNVEVFLPPWARTGKRNALTRVIGRLILAYYLYISLKYEPKNIKAEKYKVQVNI